MAIIYSYPTRQPVPQDLILGMQASNGKKTVVFTVEDLTQAATESIIHNNLPAQFSTIEASGLITGNTSGIHYGSLDSTVTGATQAAGTNNTTIATTSYVQTELSTRPFVRVAGTSILANDSGNLEIGTPAYSFTFGRNNTLANDYSAAGGLGNVVETQNSFAFGSNVAIAVSDVVGVGSAGAFATGTNTVALGEGAFASGLTTDRGSVLILTSGGTGFTSDDIILTASDTQSAVNPVTIKVKLTISGGSVTAVEPITFPAGMTANMPFQVFASGGGIACQFVSTTAAIKKVGSHGNYAHTFGKNCYSEGQFSLAGGQDVDMIGNYNFSWGNANKVTPSATAGMYHNTMFGYNNTSQPGGENGYGGIYSTVLGRNNDLYDVSLSLVSGEDITATQTEGSLITGDLHSVNKSYWGLISGYQNTVEGSNNAVLGTLNTVTSDNSLTYGKSNTKSGDYSIAGGLSNNVSSEYSATFGKENTNEAGYSIVSGEKNKATASYSAIISSENSLATGTRSTVLGGSKAIASGTASLAAGEGSIAQGSNNVAIGENALTGISTETGVLSASAISLGVNTIAMGYGAFNIGVNQSPSLTYNLTTPGTGFTIEDDSIRTVTDLTNLVTVQVKLDISNGVVTKVSPLSFPAGFDVLSFELSPTGTGTACTFSTLSTFKLVGAHNNGAIAMGENCFSGGQQSFAGGLDTTVNGNRTFAYGSSLRAMDGNSGGCVLFGNDNEITLGSAAIYAASFGNGNTITGSYSLTHGFQNTTSGTYSTGIGTLNTPSGDYSLAYGHSNDAGGSYSIGLGEDNTASAANSISLGKLNTASGVVSIALGESNTASGANSFGAGKLNTTSGEGSFGIGTSNTVSGGNAFGLGTLNIVSGAGAIALGDQNNVSGIKSIAGGQENAVTGMFSTAFGFNHTVGGRWGGAFGHSNTLGGDYCAVFGFQNSTSGSNCTIGGTLNTLNGTSSTAFGSANEIVGNWSFAGGNGNDVTGNYSTVFGFLNEITADGAVAIGEDNEVTGAGGGAIGNDNTVSGAKSFAIGSNSTVDTDNNIVVGTARNTLPLASTLVPRFEVATGGTDGTSTGAQTVSVSGTGSGYPAGTNTYSTAVTSGGSGTGLQVEIVANYANGAIMSAGVVSSGSGYNVGDVIAITGAPAGSGGILTVTSLGDNTYTSVSVAVPHGAGSGSSPHAASGLVFTALKDSPSYADDTAAATGGVNVGELYHTSGVVKVRLA